MRPQFLYFGLLFSVLLGDNPERQTLIWEALLKRPFKSVTTGAMTDACLRNPETLKLRTSGWQFSFTYQWEVLDLDLWGSLQICLTAICLRTDWLTSGESLRFLKEIYRSREHCGIFFFCLSQNEKDILPLPPASVGEPNSTACKVRVP